MLSFRIEDKDITIKDLDKGELPIIAGWFEDSGMCQYRYAMGVDTPITYNALYEKYLEVLINAHEFFLCISLNSNIIGFIKGRVEYKDKGEVWIMAFLIDACYQNMELGSRALRLLTDEFYDKLGISDYYACLVKENTRARNFWEKNGFAEYRRSKGYFTINNKDYDLVIMHKSK